MLNMSIINIQERCRILLKILVKQLNIDNYSNQIIQLFLKKKTGIFDFNNTYTYLNMFKLNSIKMFTIFL